MKDDLEMRPNFNRLQIEQNNCKNRPLFPRLSLKVSLITHYTLTLIKNKAVEFYISQNLDHI